MAGSMESTITIYRHLENCGIYGNLSMAQIG